MLASAEDDSSLLLSLTLLAQVTNILSEYNNLQVFISVMVSMMLCDEICFPTLPSKNKLAKDFIPCRLTIQRAMCIHACLVKVIFRRTKKAIFLFLTLVQERFQIA